MKLPFYLLEIHSGKMQNLSHQNFIKNLNDLTIMSKILAEENADLQNQLDETRQQLHFALEDLNDEKKGHNFALEKLKADKEKIEEDLTDTIATTMMLEKQIEELKIENSNFRESQFFQKTPPISDLFQSSFDEYNDPFSVNQNADDNNEPIANRYVVCTIQCDPYVNSLRGDIYGDI